MKKLIINESEKSQIMALYGNVNEDITNDIVITDWLSPDEKYVVFLDELYDIKNKLKLGNIWEDYTVLKTFLHHTFATSDLPKQLKENAETVLNNSLLLEGKQNLNELKSAVKILVNEGILNSFKNWVVKTGKSTVDGFVQFAKDAYKGVGNFIDKISKGEWKEVFKLLGQGVLYLLRKLRGAMYHPVGMIIDAILVATGIGKAVQWIPWALIVALDIYEMVSGDYEENLPTWQRLLFLGIDILGLVTAGVAAKAAKAATAGARDLTSLAKSPAGKKTLETMVGAAEKAPGMLKKASTYLSTTFPKGAKFINGILGSIGKFIESLTSGITKALNGVGVKTAGLNIKGGVKAGLGTGAIIGGLGTYEEQKAEKERVAKTQLADKIVTNPNLANNINNGLLQQLNNA